MKVLRAGPAPLTLEALGALSISILGVNMSGVENIISGIIAAISLAFAIWGIGVAFKSGILKRVRIAGFEFEASEYDREKARDLIGTLQGTRSEDVPFETEQLALYYGQVLSQSKISFWFSLIFASLGFAVIVVAGFLYTGENTGATLAQFTAGLVMDAVAALFFTQSRNAQEAMGEFFDKLRRDRQHLESRRLCESITNPLIQDALRMQLALHYAEIADSSTVTKSLIDTAVASLDPRPVAIESPSQNCGS
jgi:hypothetical protein